MKRILALILLTGFFLNVAAQYKLTNPNATKEAQELLNFLQSIRGKNILSGQHNYPHEISIYSDSVLAITGKEAVVWGSDFSYHKNAVANRQNIINEAIAKYKKGHIITLMYHQVRPQDDEPDGWKESVQNEVSDQQWEDLLTPGTEIHKKWLEKVDTVAYYLKQLQDKNIPVIWRPYHEMNGKWFWWGGKNDFPRLWKMLYDRYVNHHKLNNLIWVWNANTPNKKETDNNMSYERYFPGLETVDILAVDVYRGEFEQSYYDELLELANGKIVAIGECGPVPSPNILDNQPQFTWFMVWSHFLWTHNKKEDVIKLYQAPRVITLDEIPEIN